MDGGRETEDPGPDGGAECHDRGRRRMLGNRRCRGREAHDDRGVENMAEEHRGQLRHMNAAAVSHPEQHGEHRRGRGNDPADHQHHGLDCDPHDRAGRPLRFEL